MLIIRDVRQNVLRRSHQARESQKGIAGHGLCGRGDRDGLRELSTLIQELEAKNELLARICRLGEQVDASVAQAFCARPPERESGGGMRTGSRVKAW
jgi:hypothetical protein